MVSARVLMGKKHQMSMQFEGWLERLWPPERGDIDELYRQVAMHGRNLGVEGRPASAALMQILLLEDTLTALAGPDHPRRVELREMTRIMVDAHAVGAGQRQTTAHHKELMNSAPLVNLPSLGPVVFVVGPMTRDILDTALGRVLRKCAGMGAHQAGLDVSSSTVDADLLHCTLRGFAHSDPGKRYRLTVFGLEDPNATLQALQTLGCPLDMIALRGRLDDDVNNP